MEIPEHLKNVETSCTGCNKVFNVHESKSLVQLSVNDLYIKKQDGLYKAEFQSRPVNLTFCSPECFTLFFKPFFNPRQFVPAQILRTKTN